MDCVTPDLPGRPARLGRQRKARKLLRVAVLTEGSRPLLGLPNKQWGWGGGVGVKVKNYLQRN